MMNLILIQHGYPIAVIPNTKRIEYIDSLSYAQEHNDDTSRFLEIVSGATRESLIDYLRIISTAPESKGVPFYQEMQTLLKEANRHYKI